MPSSIAILQAPPVPESDERVPSQRILGVRFFAGDLREAIDLGLRGGLIVAPAAPNMSALQTDHGTREALLKADLAIADSGLMVLLWRIIQGESIPRISGLRYLVNLLKEPALHQPGNIFWVMPNVTAQARTMTWLRKNGFPVSEEDFYVAPFYGPKIHDPALLALVRSRRPGHVIMGLGGGTQERLGLYLRNLLDFRPSIHCIGAAIGFLTGDQVAIPDWADQLYLGWLFRCISRPNLYIPRYWRARGLVKLMYRYREKLPKIADVPSTDCDDRAQSNLRCSQG